MFWRNFLDNCRDVIYGKEAKTFYFSIVIALVISLILIVETLFFPTWAVILSLPALLIVIFAFIKTIVETDCI